MKWIQKIFGENQQETFVHRLRREFKFLEDKFGYRCDNYLDPETSEAPESHYLVAYANSGENRSIHIAAPAKTKQNITIILYCESTPEKVTIRDIDKYLPVKYLRAFYAPNQYNSSDYIGQIVGLDTVLQNYKTTLLEYTHLLNGNAWVDRSEFDRKLFETGKFRYASSAERFVFIDQAKLTFEFLEKELGYRLASATDLAPPYNDSEPLKHIAYSNKERNSFVSVEYDLREERFGIMIYDYANGLDRNSKYELFNPLDMKNRQDYGFLKEAANRLKKRLIEHINEFQ